MAGDHCMSQDCADAQAHGAGIAISALPAQIPQLCVNFTCCTNDSLWLFPGSAVCFCSAKQWPRSKQQRLQFYAPGSEQGSRSLNHRSQSPTTEMFAIRNP